MRLAKLAVMRLDQRDQRLAVNGTGPAARPDPAEVQLPVAHRWTRPRLSRAALIAAATLVVVAIFVGPKVRSWLATPPPAGLLFASGRVEGRITTLSPKTSAWVAALHVDEGQPVAAGQVLATLDDQAQRERLRSAEEQLNALTARLRAADTQLAMMDRQVTLQIEQAGAARREADTRVRRARVQALQAQREDERAARLGDRELIAPQEAERARLAAAVADHAVAEAEAALETSDKQLALARLGAQQLEAMRAERDALARQEQQAQAQVAEQRTNVADFAIRSPITGRVLTRSVELGERVGDGTPLFTLVDLDRLYVKIYVPEPSIGKVALGQDARVYVDAYPERPFAGRVSRVSQEAEFTPKNVETREERVKLVFAVEVALTENPGGVLKPGMPADAIVRWRPDAPWPTR
jgi:HlyD family secretion protein